MRGLTKKEERLGWITRGHEPTTFKKQTLINFCDLKKGDVIKTNHLHPLHHVTAKIMESPKQGRGVKETILCEVHGSQLGLFDEIGSIYSKQVLLKLNADNKTWARVVHAT